jgi:predicted SprT family Zn-dependent metalloprotease
MKLAAILLTLLATTAYADPRGPILDEMMTSGDSHIVVRITTTNRLLSNLEWVYDNMPEIFDGTPEHDVWFLELGHLQGSFAATDFKEKKIIFNQVDARSLPDEDIRSILIHEITHARLFSQGVMSSTHCLMTYHELTAYLTEIHYMRITKPTTRMRFTNLAGFEKYNTEYRIRYCDTWFAPTPTLQMPVQPPDPNHP